MRCPVIAWRSVKPRRPAVETDVFLDLIAASRLLSADQLQDAFDRFLNSERAPYSKGSDLIALADYLVWRNLLTRWQCELLLRGENQQFFFGHYKFLNHLGSKDGRESFEVQDTIKNCRVVLRFPLYPTHMAGTIYEVIQIAAKA